MRKIILVAIISLSALFTNAQDVLKVMQYNLLNYGNVTDWCTTDNNDFHDKEPLLHEIIQYIQPDIFTVNELGNVTYVHQRILDSVMNKNSAKQYGKADYVNTNGSDLVNMLYYNTDKLVYVSAESVQNEVRDIVLYRMYYKSPNLAQTNDTAWINCIVCHLKASDNSTSRATRARMTSAAMAYLKQHNYDGNNMFMGDFNIYKSNVDAYQNLIDESDVNFKFFDPINTPGKWNNNGSYADVHTQSTHSTASSNGCTAGGGLDDRFDFILISNDLKQGNNHITYKNNSYKVIGNDGNHFDKSINNGTNNSVPANILNALYNNSDHLPIVLELEVDNLASGIGKADNNNFIINFQNPTNGILDLHIESDDLDTKNIQIWSIQSQKVYDKSFSGNIINQKISLNHTADGMYILMVTNAKGQVEYSSKIIKQN